MTTDAAEAIYHQDGSVDHRYTVTSEYCGDVEPRYIARFAGGWIGKAETESEAWNLARRHQGDRFRRPEQSGTDDPAVLTVRLPDWRQVPGLEYGALVARNGGAWRYVRPEGWRTWGLCREVPAAVYVSDDDSIVEAVRRELAMGASDGRISFRTDHSRDEQVAAVVALVDALWPAGGEVFGFMVEPWEPGGWRDGLMAIADYLDGGSDALRAQRPILSVRDLVEADTGASMLVYRLRDEGRAGDAQEVERVRERAAGALYAPPTGRGPAGGAA